MKVRFGVKLRRTQCEQMSSELPVYTENLSAGVVVMKSAQDGA